MVVVECNRNPEGRIVSFTVKGHAGYADEGRDIICAAASAIAYTAVGWFETKYHKDGDESERFFTEDDGFMKWSRERCPEKDEKDVTENDAVLEAMVLGFRQIEYSYGKKYLSIKDKSGGAFLC